MTCESCHGPGKAHVDGGGDASKIFQFTKATPKQVEQKCLSCHVGEHPNFERTAHGEAQIFGWVGLFIMGFAYQAFPRMWQTTLVEPRLAVIAFGLMVGGLVVRTAGIAAAEAWTSAAPVALAG